ncbi:MAG: hypothetical protein RMM51_12255 [Verrucomicrobiae bacterium]|nr:hypothetical protein [Verrucomicrobiae bacterium]
MNLQSVAEKFLLHGDYMEAQPYGSGHINDTYAATFDQAGTRVRYIFQRINHRVFKNPVALMENIYRVTTHVQAKLAGARSRRALTLVPARDGQPFHRDEAGNFWRCYLFIEGARTYDTVESPTQAYEAARAFGGFQELLADLPAPRLHETIPDFHHTPKRLAALEAAIAADAAGRVRDCGPEIEFVMKRRAR